jgi:prepilin-type N-terminal cleavage/methylation domain-containing protein
VTRARANHGFTLLEVLVAVFIMSLVITFAFQAYRGIAEAYARVSEEGTRDRAARVLLDRIERELTGAVMVQREDGADPLTHPYFFFAEPREYEDASGFELRFITQTPLRSPGSPPAALALVTYGVVPSESGQGLALLRQEEPVPPLLAKQVEWTHPQVMADNVSAFTLGFGGEAAGDTAGWDSTGVEQLDALPDSIDVVVSLWEMAPDGEPWPGLQIGRSVVLPVRPFRLAPDEVTAENAGECTSGMSVVACMNHFARALASASPALQAAITDAQSQTTDACWNSGQPSAALERLKSLMGDLPAFYPGACP